MSLALNFNSEVPELSLYSCALIPARGPHTFQSLTCLGSANTYAPVLTCPITPKKTWGLGVLGTLTDKHLYLGGVFWFKT